MLHHLKSIDTNNSCNQIHHYIQSKVSSASQPTLVYVDFLYFSQLRYFYKHVPNPTNIDFPNLL